MENKLRIIDAKKFKTEKQHCYSHMYWLSDGSGPHRPKELGRYVGLPWETIKKRMKAYGRGSWLVFYHGTITREMSADLRVNRAGQERAKKAGVEVVGAVLQDGSITTRSGKIIPTGSSIENDLFLLPDAAKCPWKEINNQSLANGTRLKPSTFGSDKEKLHEYNAKMERRGFLRPVEFAHVAVMSI